MGQSWLVSAFAVTGQIEAVFVFVLFRASRLHEHKYALLGWLSLTVSSAIAATHRPRTVNHRHMAMSSFSAHLEAPNFSPLQLWLNVQDHRFLSSGIILGLIILYAAHYFSS